MQMNEYNKLISYVPKLCTGNRKNIVELSTLQKLILNNIMSSFLSNLPNSPLLSNLRKFVMYLSSYKSNLLVLSYDELQFMKYMLNFAKKNLVELDKGIKWRNITKIHQKIINKISISCMNNLFKTFNKF